MRYRYNLDNEGDKMSYKIGSFNMKNMGLTARTKRDFLKLAEIIQGEQFDIVAMQEILSGGQSLEYFIKHSLGPHWQMRWAEPGDTRSTGTLKDLRGEGFAYIWNSKRVRLAGAVTEKGRRIFEPRIVNSLETEVPVDCSTFARTPYYARFEPCNGSFFEIRLINVHLYYGDNTVQEIEKRKKEYDILTQKIFPKINTLRKYGNNRQAITIALGDYNLNIYRFRGEAEKRINKNTYLNERYDYTEGTRVQRIQTVQDGLTTLKRTVDEEEAEIDDRNPNRGYSQNYDHFTIDTNSLDANGIQYRYKRVDAVRKYCRDDFELYQSSISDHIPISIELMHAATPAIKNIALNGMNDWGTR